MSIHKQLSASLDILLSNYSDIFKDMLGTIVDYKAKLLVKPVIIPNFCKAQRNYEGETRQARICWNHGEGDSQ